MSVDTSRLLRALRSSPFWQSPPNVCACALNDSPGLSGLDLIWYFRRSHAALGKHFSIEASVAHYLSSSGPNAASPNLAFDEFWYRQRYADVEETVRTGRYRSGWEHYLLEGAAKRYNPAYWFDENWYAKQNADAMIDLRAGKILCAFEQYLRDGVQGDTSPSMYFNPAWYRSQHLSGERDGRLPIIDYLRKKPVHRPCPAPFFDPDWYTSQYLSHTNEQWLGSAYEHYIFVGRNRAHSPSPYFHEAEYRARYPEATRSIVEGKYATALEHYAAEGLVNGYFASHHLGAAGLDYRSPAVMQNYDQSLRLNLKQVAQLRQLLMATRNTT